ncbi:winged helix DNA-binding domain-containing protein [Nakamurella sp. YIM 132087]|uniref:Winged helix DNA-binding domain-containing protein n=1 Tax=Nakamurella alba TaxID=2665158 RepID=A0A7K1FT11_9ACTN|nr:winged helix DNA-binding domain-containing protein [Nakamurella alba]MTD17292.1 winged helix DNA-binding domain-containing protein [Nakamurella alba]
MDRSRVFGHRMREHRLLGGTAADAVDAVRAMVGAHAQIPSAADLAIGLRLRAFAGAGEGLTRTFGPRGTVHLLPTADLGHWLPALAAVPGRGAADPYLDADRIDQVCAALGPILADGPRTLVELDEAVPAALGSWAAEQVIPDFGGLAARWRRAIAVAAHRGVLCFGPNRGRRTTYAALPEPPAPQPERAAVQWLAGEYLRAYGPVTAKDLARWLATDAGWAAAALGSVDGVVRDGDRFDVPRTDEPPAVAGTVRLLPYFDPYVVGGQPREVLFPPPVRARAMTNSQPGTRPVLLVDGVVAGIWHLARRGRRATLTVETNLRWNRALRSAFDDEIALLETLLDTTAQVVLGEVAVGGHA